MYSAADQVPNSLAKHEKAEHFEFVMTMRNSFVRQEYFQDLLLV
jgi:hypothetical protein